MVETLKTLLCLIISATYNPIPRRAIYYKVYSQNIGDEITSLRLQVINDKIKNLDSPKFKRNYVIPIVNKMCTTKVLIYEAIQRFIMFLFFWLKIILIFSMAALILESLRPDSFKEINCIQEGYFRIMCLFERILYFTFVTFVTLGYGDISPTTMLSRFFINIQAITSFVLTTFGVGIFVALLIEASDLAWNSRRKIITRDILSTLKNGNPYHS